MVVLVLVVAAAPDTARTGDFGGCAVVVVAVVGLVAGLEVADELLGLARVLEAVRAHAELLRRRVQARLFRHDAGDRRAGAGVLARRLAGGAGFGLALFRPLTVTGHWGLAGLAVRRVVAAPLAVLAQLDAVRRVPLGLVRLVVAPLAVLARKRDCDSYISACHELAESSAGGAYRRGDDWRRRRAERAALRAAARGFHRGAQRARRRAACRRRRPGRRVRQGPAQADGRGLGGQPAGQGGARPGRGAARRRR